MWCILAQLAISWCIGPTSWLTFMYWCIDVCWCVKLVLIDVLVVCWIDMLVDIYWGIDVLVGVLDRHVGWRLLAYALTSWLCVESICWLTFTDALTCWLVCWSDILVDIYWCIDVFVGALDRRANVCTVLLNAIVAFGYKKKQEKNNYIFITFSKLVENLHSVVIVGWNVKHSII